jgi:hypothetical protein
MDGKIRLPVAVQIQLSQSDAASDDGLFVDRAYRCCLLPRDFTGQSNVQGEDLHFQTIVEEDRDVDA